MAATTIQAEGPSVQCDPRSVQAESQDHHDPSCRVAAWMATLQAKPPSSGCLQDASGLDRRSSRDFITTDRLEVRKALGRAIVNRCAGLCSGSRVASLPPLRTALTMFHTVAGMRQCACL